MPRFFFDVHDGVDIHDQEGTELDDIRAARIAAVELAGGLLKDEASKFWDGDDWQIEVRDETALTLFVLNFSAVDAPAIADPRLPRRRTPWPDA